MTFAPLYASSSRCGPTRSISSSTEDFASRPEYQPDTQARPYSASFAFSAAGSRRELVAELEAFIADLLAFGQRGLERRIAAERGQIVVTPADRVDAYAHVEAHGQSLEQR